MTNPHTFIALTNAELLNCGTTELVTFTEEILNRKLHLLYPVLCLCIPSKKKKFCKNSGKDNDNNAEGKCMFKIISEAKNKGSI